MFLTCYSAFYFFCLQYSPSHIVFVSFSIVWVSWQLYNHIELFYRTTEKLQTFLQSVFVFRPIINFRSAILQIFSVLTPHVIFLVNFTAIYACTLLSEHHGVNF